MTEQHGVSRPPLDRDLLGLYLSDHLTGATAGLSRAQQMADAYRDREIGPQLRVIADQLEGERDLLVTVIEELGLNRRRHRQALAWAMEHLGRLKLNKRLFSTSPLTVHLELELLRSAVNGKVGLWETLVDLSGELGLDRLEFADLVERAADQSQTLTELHGAIRGQTFRAAAG